jgi:hypothetical protein
MSQMCSDGLKIQLSLKIKIIFISANLQEL